MKNFLRGLVCGALLMWAANAFMVEAQVEEPLTIRAPRLVGDTTWTAAQRADLERALQDMASQVNTNVRSIAGRMRQALISGRTYHGTVHTNP